MNIMLAHGYFLREDPIEQQVMKPYPPLGLLFLSGYLKKQQVDHHVFDSTFQSMPALEDELLNRSPDILGLYVNFLTRSNILKIIAFVREKLQHCQLVLGGPDVRYHAARYLAHGAHFIVLGEGEQTFFELLKALETGAEVNTVPGLVYRDDKGEEVGTGERPHERDLSVFGLPNREAVDMENYMAVWKRRHGYSSITVNTQRGCPFSCTWCSHAVFGDTYRRREVREVVDELKHIQEKYNPDSYWFVDDVFTMSAQWIREFKEVLGQEGIRIRYECITRADRLNNEVLKDLKESGCHMLWIGAESGSQHVLDLMDRRVQATQVREMIRQARGIGIRTGTFIMLGYPGEGKEDIRETIRHLKLAAPDEFTINLAYPIKGTKLYDLVEKDLEPGKVWEDTPDRDLVFKRKFPTSYYKLAIRKVYNEVNAHRALTDRNRLRFLKLKVKSLLVGAAMKLTG